MATAIKEYTPHFVMYLKGDQTVELTEMSKRKVEQSLENEQNFIKVGDNIYNKFQIQKIEKVVPATDVDEYIFNQKKSIRDKLKLIAKSKGIVFTSIQHVNNHIKAINDGNI